MAKIACVQNDLDAMVHFRELTKEISGAIRQTLPLPGGYIGIAFAPDGRRAYVSGVTSDGTPPPGSKGTGGDVIHVYSVNPSWLLPLGVGGLSGQLTVTLEASEMAPSGPCWQENIWIELRMTLGA